MKLIQSIRTAIAATDTNLRHGDIEYMTPRTQKRAMGWHAVEAALAGVNAVVAGTPAAWFTGGATVALGLGQIVAGYFEQIAGGLMGSSKYGKRTGTNGLLNVIGGLSAQVPGVGTAVNGALFAMETVQAVNVAAGQPGKPADR